LALVVPLCVRTGPGLQYTSVTQISILIVIIVVAN
jgi:uncharacterized protein YraI